MVRAGEQLSKGTGWVGEGATSEGTGPDRQEAARSPGVGEQEVLSVTGLEGKWQLVKDQRRGLEWY